MRISLIERIFTIKLINGLLIVMLLPVAVKKQNRASIHQKGQTADNQIVTKIAKTKWGAGGLITNVKSTVYLSVTKVQSTPLGVNDKKLISLTFLFIHA